MATATAPWAALAAALASAAAPAVAGDLLLTGAKPDRLLVIDATTRKLRSEFHIPGANGLVGTIMPSSDGRRAYVLVNRMESVVGLELKTGKPVFRADLSSPGERVKAFFAMTLTPDGRELVVYELPTRLKPGEYEVLEPRFAVYRTDAGLEAKPVRSFPAPRRVHMLLMRPSGKSFYAIGVDLYEYELASGKQLGMRGIQHWQQPRHSQPDLLAMWPVTEPTGVFVSPVSSDVGEPGKSVPMTALMSLDLASGALEYHDFEPAETIIFSTVLAPDRKSAYGVYTTLSHIDTEHHRLANRVPLDHTYYTIAIASDGHELYLGGTMCDVGFYDPATLAKRALLKLPGCADQSVSTLRVVREH